MVAFFIGGSTQESNLPKRFLTPSNGFEDRASHQCPSCFQYTEGLDRNLALLVYGALGEIRTPDTQIRSLVLYPAELQAQSILLKWRRERDSNPRYRFPSILA